MGKNKNRKKSPQLPNSSEIEFDVRKNLQKLRSGHHSSGYITGQQYSRNENNRELISNQSGNESLPTTDLLGFSDNMYFRYDKLKDDLNLEIKEIKKEQGSFAKEISEKYISKIEFWIIIGGLLTILSIIGGLFYKLSYEEMKVDVRQIKNDVNEINITINPVKKNYVNSDTLEIKNNR